MAQTLEQQRAAYAWKCVNAVGPQSREEYKNLAKAMPMMVMNSGLMQTLAFLEEKGKEHHRALLGHVSHWVSAQGAGDHGPAFAQLMSQLLNSQPLQFRQATAETHAILRWIRQFAAVV